MNNIIQITPFMHVTDLEKALSFFNDILGFTTRFRMSNYAYVQRGNAAVRILESRQADGAPFVPHRGFAYYVDVSDVDAMAVELKPKLERAGVPFSGPANQHYRQRELIIGAPDGNKFVFGQAIES